MRDLQRIDLNLLVAFDALMAERNVTRAAERMAVGQPAMSASLARLRKLFDDPLLVREGRAFVPTPVADSLVGPIRQALSLMEGALGRRRAFDAAADEQTFTLLASDYVLLVLLRSLLSELATEAPNVRINVRPISGDYADQLRRGQIDLFIVPREIERSGVPLPSEDVFQDRFVCAVDVDHPEVGDTMSRKQFQTLPYLSYDGGPLPSAAQLQLHDRGIERVIDVTTQSFVVAPLMLRGTRFLTLVHERLGRSLAAQARIRLLEPPFDLGPITEAMFWSPRHQDSPAHRWLRERIRQAAAALET
ncbi:LysR family transcriptional regulator [Rhodococcus sp. (in: high G+C Gram-positive bacteria)]|uniref:LysR family transcriptional regulator n=1 Tax=Rhodococcus sp. TaxID=1831 RepID=UPI00257B9D54|nr:LysR family transcriptional regulator [Rhodococcus sp. (in: high G+C Gram-positive bacteria)]MBQ9055546.1 LysR family transcriptional regulator [Rhodococcus sp. (in: high G+C Gram-positive bacteria)]